MRHLKRARFAPRFFGEADYDCPNGAIAPVTGTPIREAHDMTAKRNAKATTTPAATEAPTEVTPPTHHTPTVEAYRAGDAKVKATIRARVKSSVMDAVTRGDLAEAQYWVATEKLLTTPKPVAEEVAPEEIIARRIATLRAAIAHLATGAARPAGMDPIEIDTEAIMDRAEAIIKAGDDLGREVWAEGRKVAEVKITRSRDLHDIAEWIIRAMSTVKVGGEVTLAQVRTLGAIDGDDYRPTTGALRARMESKNKITGVAIAMIGDKAVFGIRRTAEAMSAE